MRAPHHARPEPGRQHRSYIGHSWLGVGMIQAAGDPGRSVLLMAVYSVRVPH